MSSFEKIIAGGYYYVDKTEYIEVLEGLNTNFPILLRQRRFGKTLFIDTLAAYYDKNKKDQFDKLFKNTYIGAHKTELVGSYYVMHFNLSGLDTRDSNRLETYVLDRIFITGVTSLTMDSLTSGFNISTNISNTMAMNGALGFTVDEVENLIDYMEIPDKTKVLQILKENYNGYLFAENSDERIYNSNMIIFYLCCIIWDY